MNVMNDDLVSTVIDWLTSSLLGLSTETDLTLSTVLSGSRSGRESESISITLEDIRSFVVGFSVLV